MYAISATTRYARSLKRCAKSGTFPIHELERVVDTLVRGTPLSAKYKDHKLMGVLGDYRECHIKSDVLLIYQIRKKECVLILIDIGSHSELFS